MEWGGYVYGGLWGLIGGMGWLELYGWFGGLGWEWGGCGMILGMGLGVYWLWGVAGGGWVNGCRKGLWVWMGVYGVYGVDGGMGWQGGYGGGWGVDGGYGVVGGGWGMGCMGGYGGVWGLVVGGYGLYGGVWGCMGFWVGYAGPLLKPGLLLAATHSGLGPSEETSQLLELCSWLCSRLKEPCGLEESVSFLSGESSLYTLSSTHCPLHTDEKGHATVGMGDCTCDGGGEKLRTGRSKMAAIERMNVRHFLEVVGM
uniref:Uncharacterized protein n=1 Tax=Knipowitschia caucasica TaxID=637954 RepID=A0AAV2JIW3_KNICA